MLRLNLGAAQTYLPGFVNIDIAEHVDVTLDLGRDNLPFDDDSVDLIFSYHTLEHVPDFDFAIGEIFRVLKHNGVLLLGLPYVTLTEFNLVNPYHLHNFSEHTFWFFDPKRLRGSASEDSEVMLVESFHRFYYMGLFGALPMPARRWARRHLLNVVRQFDVGLVAVKDPDQPVDIGSARARYLVDTFDSLLEERTRYEPHPGRERRGSRIPRWIDARVPSIRRVLRNVRKHYEVRRQ